MLQGKSNLRSDSVAFQEVWWGAHLPAHALSLCLLKWFEQEAYCKWADNVVTLQVNGDSLFHFHTASDIIFTDCTEDPLMYIVAELLTAQWTDKCSYTADNLVCIALCSCSQWKSWQGTTMTAPLPPKASVILWKCFSSKKIANSSHNE